MPPFRARSETCRRQRARRRAAPLRPPADERRPLPMAGPGAAAWPARSRSSTSPSRTGRRSSRRSPRCRRRCARRPTATSSTSPRSATRCANCTSMSSRASRSDAAWPGPVWGAGQAVAYGRRNGIDWPRRIASAFSPPSHPEHAGFFDGLPGAEPSTLTGFRRQPHRPAERAPQRRLGRRRRSPTPRRGSISSAATRRWSKPGGDPLFAAAEADALGVARGEIVLLGWARGRPAPRRNDCRDDGRRRGADRAHRSPLARGRPAP